jgi:hypothetical protein
MSVELDTSFVVLQQETTPAEALRLLGDRKYAVVVDETGHVVALGTATELAEGRPLPPGVEIPAGIPLVEVVNGEAVTLLELNSHGAVVVRESEVLGVVPASVIDETVASGHVASRTMGEASDSALPGDIRVPTARIMCAWLGCGYINVITFYDPDRPSSCGTATCPTMSLL